MGFFVEEEVDVKLMFDGCDVVVMVLLGSLKKFCFFCLDLF